MKQRVLLSSIPLLFSSACMFAPGMHMDEGQAVARGRKVDADFKVLSITADLVRAQNEDARARLAQRTQAEDPLRELATTYEYRVRPFDVLTVIVWDHPELTIPAGEFRSETATGHPVAPDGTMFYPHVGVVEVAGKTTRQIRELLTERLGRYIQRPQLDVKIAAFRSQKVHVTGEVIAPSTFPLTDVPIRALEAINAAKGFGPEADPQRVTLTRDGRVHVLDLLSVQETGNTGQNWVLKDGDVLHVPDRSFNRVYVLGEVRKPTTRIMHKGRMTLADAIGDSEGLDPLTSEPSRIYVIRGAFEQPTIYRLDASSPDALLLAVQFQLQPQDVVYVSTHELTKWNRVMSQILPTVQALWQAYISARAVLPALVTP